MWTRRRAKSTHHHMNKDYEIRFAYFGSSLRIVYDCEDTAMAGEEIISILRTEAFSKGAWHDIHDGIDCLLGNLNSDFKEAIGECALIVSEDGDVIRDTRAKAYKINA